MLCLLFAPDVSGRLELGVITEHVVQIRHVVSAVRFDESRGLNHLEQIQVHSVRRELRPRQIGNFPVLLHHRLSAARRATFGPGHAVTTRAAYSLVAPKSGSIAHHETPSRGAQQG